MKTVHLPNKKGEITTVVKGIAFTGVNKIIVIDVDCKAETNYETT